MRKLTDRNRKKIRRDLGKSLKRWRQIQSMTQTDLGKMLQLHQSAIARVEKGSQSLSAEQLVWLEALSVESGVLM